MFAGLAILSVILMIWQWLGTLKFPLHERVKDTNFAPGITLLKPLKGCDATSADSIRSWFKQNYNGPMQILFGVAEEGDAIVPVIRQLMVEYPGISAQLIFCENLAGANLKVAKLAQLEPMAEHELILVSDADVRVPQDFLHNMVAEWRESNVGLVNCFYRQANPATLAMQWEGVAINADFWSQVLQSKTLKPLDFALGAVMLTSRERLREIGGFASLANCLADDYQLGHRIAECGHDIALCPVVVECWDPPSGWSQVWRHQLRWGRTIRVCQPLPYFFSILSNASLWPILWLGFSLATSATYCASLTAILFLFIRISLAQNLQRRFTPERNLVSPFWLITLKDLLQTGIWLGAFAGNTIEWRGRIMRLRPDGTLKMVGAEGFEPPTHSV